MCITSETCRANSVIKTALNNLHQAGPNKTHYELPFTMRDELYTAHRNKTSDVSIIHRSEINISYVANTIARIVVFNRSP